MIERKARTIRAFRAQKEEILEGDVFCEGSARIEFKYKFRPCPVRRVVNILFLSIDDETRYSENSGIISSNIFLRNMTDLCFIFNIRGE